MIDIQQLSKQAKLRFEAEELVIVQNALDHQQFLADKFVFIDTENVNPTISPLKDQYHNIDNPFKAKELDTVVNVNLVLEKQTKINKIVE